MVEGGVFPRTWHADWCFFFFGVWVCSLVFWCFCGGLRVFLALRCLFGTLEFWCFGGGAGGYMRPFFRGENC